MSMCESSLVLLEKGIFYGQCVLLAKLCHPLPCFILDSNAKFACDSRYFLTFYFCIPVPKKGNAKECSNCEIPDVQAGFRKDRGTRDQIANIHWIIEKAREFQKNICFIDYAKAFDCVDHNKL